MRQSAARQYKSLSDDQWHQLLLASMTDTSLGLPGFPSQQTQETFVGRSYDSALQEAFDFYRKIKSKAPINPDTKILDFGVGWGRIIRYFSKDVLSPNLFGVDVDPAILEECEHLNIPGRLDCIEPMGKLPYGSRFFDVIYAFSVFSHISEASAAHWLKELMRTLRPNATLVLTSTSDRFLSLCAACKMKKRGRTNYEEIYAEMFENPQYALQRYHEGRHVYAPAGGASEVLDKDTYGWASMPYKFVEQQIGNEATIEFSDDPSQFEQAIFVIKKRNPFSIRTLLRNTFNMGLVSR